jgi:peptide/nickel transport system substrate-binding protein
MKKGLLNLLLLTTVAVVAVAYGQGVGEKPKGPKETLVIAAAAIPVTLDSELGGSLESWEAALNWGDPIVGLQIKTNPDGAEGDISVPPVCILCETYAFFPDAKKWTITLKKGVKSFFGNELTAEDVKWGWERGAALQGVSLFSMRVSSVDVKNPITVRDKYIFDVNLTGSNPLLPQVLAVNFTPLIFDTTEAKKHATASDPWAKEWLATHTAAFGPYHVTSIVPGQEVVWVANPNYHQAAPRIKKVIYKQVPDPSTRAALLQRGEVDIAVELTPRLREELKGKPGVVIESRLGNEAVIFGLNNKLPPLDNVKVRQAIAYALPMDDIIKTVFLNQRGVKVAPGYAPEYYPGALSNWPYKRDLEQAKRLLAEAGVGSVSFRLAFNSARPTHEEMALLIKSALKELNIDVVLDKLSPAKYQEQYFTHKADSVLVQDAAWVADGPYAMFLYFHSDGVADWINYYNPTVNDLIERGSNSLDFAERAKLARQAHELIVREAPWGFYLHIGYHVPRRDNVKGFTWFTNNLLYFKYFYKD